MVSVYHYKTMKSLYFCVSKDERKMAERDQEGRKGMDRAARKTVSCLAEIWEWLVIAAGWLLLSSGWIVAAGF